LLKGRFERRSLAIAARPLFQKSTPYFWLGKNFIFLDSKFTL